MDKKGKSTDIEDILKVAFLFVLVYLILKALGVL